MDIIIKRAIVGGVVSTIVMGTGTFILGEMSGYKAMELLSSSLSGINMLCNTVILGSSTILALMLTLLSISRSADSSLTKKHYRDVLRLAKYDTILIITAVVTFLMLNLPIIQSQEVPENWYVSIYYVSLGMAAILGGGLIAIVTMLYGTIANIILIVGLGVKDHPLVNSKDSDKARKEDEEKRNEQKRNDDQAEQQHKERQKEKV
ncbi:hypothetical protein [Autumnicola musiva]|uniref:Uncharacterized protein n=1 Tax=Autumnicola musiva TaxID=3075589 RepID=A0ABU3D658_9FLAO|nr:hypothetical protein [Zunongwangia sp. F117]MDT0677017.1 hypothetical protein [Zunongwangia sp. F117]